MSVLDMDVVAVAEKIRSGKLSASEAVETYIAHLQNVNPHINSLVEDRFAAAIDEAEAADRALAQGEAQGELFGVPVSMKESFDVKGMQTTGGLPHRQGLTSETDAAIVAKLKAEGAIILGKTNTPTLCFCQESENKLYGRTNNPWDLTRTAGGSSGGEGALIAVGGAAAGIGSDIGGSLRFPAHFNGVVGFKSGDRQVSQKGSFPHIEHPFQERMLGIGPMTKSVRDAELLYGIIADHPVTKADLSDFTISVLPRENGYPLSDNTGALLQQIKDALTEKDFSTEKAVPPYFNDAALLWQEIMSVDGGASVAELAFGERRTQPVREYLKERFTGKAELHRYMTWALIGARTFKPRKKRIEDIAETLARGDEELGSYLTKRILIFPVYRCAALPHGQLYREIFSIRKTFLKVMPYVAYANVWGLPALIVPVGVDAHGLPVSVQLMSQNGNEDALFQLGKVIESRFRGYVRCEMWDNSRANTPLQAMT